MDLEPNETGLSSKRRNRSCLLRIVFIPLGTVRKSCDSASSRPEGKRFTHGSTGHVATFRHASAGSQREDASVARATKRLVSIAARPRIGA